MKNRYLARAFDTFRQHATEQRRIEQVGIKVVDRMKNKALASAFCSWNDHAADGRRAGLRATPRAWRRRAPIAAVTDAFTEVVGSRVRLRERRGRRAPYGRPRPPTPAKGRLGSGPCPWPGPLLLGRGRRAAPRTWSRRQAGV